MARENTPRAVVTAVKTAYQNITMTEGNNLNKSHIYTGCLFYHSIFRIERPTSAGAYRSLLRCFRAGINGTEFTLYGLGVLKVTNDDKLSHCV